MKVLCILLCVAFASGFYIDNNGTHEDKIVGGDSVRIQDLSYQASLLSFTLNNFCGATIIDDYWVITAAHCVENKSHILVQTGSGNRHTFSKVHRVNQIIMHKDYDTFSKNNDIALIKVKKPIEFNSEQRPIELAKSHDTPREGEMMRISGFGKIGQHLDFSDVLKAAYIPVVNQKNCERAYRPHPITDNMFCAGNEGAGACYGDSGGPGVIRGKLHGIISFGNNHSATLFLGVYIRVHKYYDWIVAKTGRRF